MISRQSLKPGSLQIIQTLGTVDSIQSADRLQFHEHGSLNQEIRAIIAYNHPVVADYNAILLFDQESGFAQVVRKRIFVHLLDKPRSERIGNRDGTANDLF